MQRRVTGYDIRGSWIVVQDGVCRYSVTPADAGVLVRSVLWEYLATALSHPASKGRPSALDRSAKALESLNQVPVFGRNTGAVVAGWTTHYDGLAPA